MTDTNTPSPDKAPIPWLRFALALLFVHFFAALHATPWTEARDTWWRLSPDLWIVLAASTLACLRFGYRAIFGHMMVLAILWIPLFRLPHQMFPMMYGGKFSLIDHAGQAVGLWNALFVDGSDHATRLYVVLGLIGIALIWLAFYLLCRFLGRQLTRPPAAIAVLVGSVMMLSLAMVENSLYPQERSRVMLKSTFGATLRQAHLIGGRGGLLPRIHDARRAVAAAPKDLGALRSADVVLFFMESYGRSLFRHETYGDKIKDHLREIERSVRADGGATTSLWVMPRVSGSQSHITHAAAISGIDLWAYRDFERFVRMTPPPLMLPRILRDQGYRSINVNPKLEVDWPASRAFFGFDEDLFGKHTTYLADGGVTYHWPNAPDQVLLAHARQMYLHKDAPPAFLMVIGGISHAPFSRIPPVLTDWERALDAKAYPPVRDLPATFLNYHTFAGIETAYLDTLKVTFRVLREFLKAADRPMLLLIIGDHQAPRTGSIRPPADDFAVPLHALSNRPALLEPFEALGANAGMIPTGDRELPVHELLPAFLRAYSQR